MAGMPPVTRLRVLMARMTIRTSAKAPVNCRELSRTEPKRSLEERENVSTPSSRRCSWERTKALKRALPRTCMPRISRSETRRSVATAFRLRRI